MCNMINLFNRLPYEMHDIIFQKLEFKSQIDMAKTGLIDHHHFIDMIDHKLVHHIIARQKIQHNDTPCQQCGITDSTTTGRKGITLYCDDCK
jgi:hypothetical protein